ncbi:glycosyltransferase family 2 protein [Flavobacterium algicola]|uniref:glycosyltransferase family 2 protein n=1 Tax=Flavobacterium algicola TaxID=556529 RepID=UPI001EFEDED8|nr:glycosyltransferase family A protein [Flavobacterium algicola]MCG9793883.1 glycosyltransferase family 2 protein [Flavobacterium algicola]
MIIIYHHKNKISRIAGVADTTLAKVENGNIAKTMLLLAKKFPNDKIVWCGEDFASKLNVEAIDLLCHHQKMMLSYSVESNVFLLNPIGYIEQSPFLKVNKEVQYPTWMMSTHVGVMHAAALSVYAGQVKPDKNFEYFLNSVAKIGMPKGLFCYSEPTLLLKKEVEKEASKLCTFTLFRFVKQHFKKRWLLLLLLNLLIYEKRLPLLPFLNAFFFKSRMGAKITFDGIDIQSEITINKTSPTIDVIIPTIGRKKYLYDVLKDLAKQTVLPKNVIIVEQNPDPKSVSDLDYVTTETWPFVIKHSFTHQAGACNARNQALDQVTSEWVFLGDDDNRFDADLIGQMFLKAAQYGTTVVTTNYILQEEVQEFNIIHQSGIFGSGNSFVKRSSLQNIRFDKALEFGYGEDTDFGMQLRNHGHDVIYFPSLRITHLKAPMGGFRTPIVQLWDAELIQPKPSPTIMFVYKKHFTKQQVNGYQIILFLKLVTKVNFTNYLYFYKMFRQKWAVSQYWASKLRDEKR